MALHPILAYAKQFAHSLSFSPHVGDSCSNISAHYERLREQEQNIARDPRREKLLQVVNMERDILSHLGSQATTKLMLKVALLVSCVAVLAGIATQSIDSSLVLYGVVVGGVCAAALNWRNYQADGIFLQRTVAHLQETIAQVEKTL